MKGTLYTDLKRRFYGKSLFDLIIFAVGIIVVTTSTYFFDFKVTVIVAVVCLAFAVIQSLYSKTALSDSFIETVNAETKAAEETTTALSDITYRRKRITDESLILLKDVTDNLNAFKKLEKAEKENSDVIKTVLKETKKLSEEDIRSLSEGIRELSGLKLKIQKTADRITELNEGVTNVFRSLTVIENIAEQTNILALNATVEAVRAGQYGKGFSIVASEFGKLATETKQAAAKISTLLQNLENTSASVVLFAEESTRNTNEAVKFITESDVRSKLIRTSIGKLSLETEKLYENSDEREGLIGDIELSSEELNECNEKNKASFEEYFDIIKLLKQRSIEYKQHFAEK